MKVSVCLADLIQFDAEAVVCPAHFSFLAGSALSGAIHKAAGIDLEKECRTKRIELFGPRGCGPYGSGMLTAGYALKARYVIHVAVPRPALLPSDSGNEDALRECYRTIVRISNENRITSVGIPCLGTDFFRWDASLSAQIATQTILSEIKPETTLDSISFVCNSAAQEKLYRETPTYAYTVH